MKRAACCASALAWVSLACHGVAAAADAVATPAAAAAAGGEQPSRWTWSGGSLRQALGFGSGAGLFRLGYWQNTVDVGANGNLQSTTSSDYPDADFYSYLLSQGITFRNQGFYVLDPRLLTGDASVRVGFLQSRQDASDLGTSQQGDITDYYLSTTLFGEMPYSANLSLAHAQYTTSQAGGGTTEASNTNQRAVLYWKETSFLRTREIAPYFSASLTASKEDLDETTSNAGQQFRRDESRESLQLEGHNGFETSDLSFSLERLDLDNRAYPLGSYSDQSANVTYSLDFGTNLNLHSDTYLYYEDRTGDFDLTTLDLEQHMFLEHSEYFSSNYYYLYQSTEALIATTTAQRAAAGVQYMPFLNVTTNADVFGSKLDLDTGTIDTAGASGGVSYNHGLPGNGVLTVSANGGMQYSNSQLQASAVPVFDESYQAPPQLGAGAGFTLNHPDVITETIVVVNVRGGGRVRATEGLDYVVDVEGNRTRIVPLPTSAVIQPGDPLEVSYLYVVDPSLESRLDSYSWYVGADWDWISVALTRDVTKQVPLSGQEQTLLSDQDRTVLQVNLVGDLGAWEARGYARASHFRDTRLMYDEIMLNESVWWRPGYSWYAGLDASQSETRYPESGRRSRYFLNRLSAAWRSERGWWADGFVSYRTNEDTDLIGETILEGFVRLRRNWPQFAFSLALGVGQRDSGNVKTVYQNVLLNVTRTF